MSSATGRTITQLVFTVAGYYFGGPAGAAIGSALGAYVGVGLFPGDPARGPRLTDLKLQISSYGGAINRVWGRMRVGGNVIWASDLIETEKTEEVGGKGGGPEVTTYSYSINAAVAICAGPIAGIRRIWADAELVYDVSDMADIDATQASGEFAQYFTLYTGTTTQLPDPTMEAALGAGNVPAYLGTAYVVFNNLPLERYGNRLPNLEFEVLAASSTAAPARALVDTISQQYATVSFPSAPIPIMMPTVPGTIRVANTQDDRVRVYSLTGQFVATEDRSELESRWPAFVPLVCGAYGLMDGSTLFGRNRNLGDNGLLVVRSGATSVEYDCAPLLPEPSIYGVVPCVDQRCWLVFCSANPVITGTTSWVLIEWTGSGLSVLRSGTVPTPIKATVIGAFGNVGLPIGFAGSGVKQFGCMESDRQHIWQLADIGSGFTAYCNLFRLEDNDTVSFITTFNAPANRPTYESGSATAQADLGYCYVVGDDQINIFHRGGALSPATVSLSAVVADICTSAGYAGGDINTAALTDPLTGYAIAQISSARAALEQLRAAFFVDAVESDDAVRFVKRGGAPAVTLSMTELGELDRPGPLSSTRSQETDLPARLNVAYLAADADYQIGTQSARRETTGSRQQQELQLAIAITDAQAAQIADVLLRDLWQGRETRTTVVGSKHMRLEPTDVVEIVDSATGITTTCRIVETRLAGSRLELTLADDRAATYTSQAVGGVTPGGQDLGIDGPAGLYLLDLPPLRERDGDAGIYSAVWGYSGRWPGAQVFVEDNGSYLAHCAGLTAARIGICDTVLGNFTGINTFDESNVLRVSVNGTLSTVTREQALAGSNAAVVGDEVIVFRTATLVSAGVYDLSGLLRGRLGTERFIATHGASERFVLLTSTTINRGAVDYARVGQAVSFKAVTLGASLSNSATKEVTFECASLRPLAPARLTCIQSTSGELLFRWIRRARLNTGWNNGADVPLDESAEQYVVEIYNGATLVRSTTTISPSFTYTAAMRSADSTAGSISLTVRAYQVSAKVGKGFAEAQTFAVGGVGGEVVSLRFNGANASTTMTDLSGKTWTARGNAQLSTAWQAGGTASLLLDGNGDWIDTPSSIDLNMGTGAFGIAAWVRPTSLTNNFNSILANGTPTFSAPARFFLLYGSAAPIVGQRLKFGCGGFGLGVDQALVLSTTTATINTNYYVEVSRDAAGTLRLFVNGNLEASANAAGIAFDFSATETRIGANGWDGVAGHFAGYIDTLRVRKGSPFNVTSYTAPPLTEEPPYSP